MARSRARKLADLTSAGNTFDDGVITAAEVTGLGTAATTAATDYATAGQGTLAASALQSGGGTVTGNLSFGDNNRAIFGAGSDLLIYHDGANSRIYDVGTGDLRIQGTNLRLLDANGENYLTAVQDGAVTLLYDNAAKIATTSTGVDVTGTVAATAFTGDGSSLTGIAGGYWVNLAEVTLGGSQVSAIDITLPTGYDQLKLEIVFPRPIGSTGKDVEMQILNSSDSAQSFSYFTTHFKSDTTSYSRDYGRFSTELVLSETYGANSSDRLQYSFVFSDTSSTTIETKYLAQGFFERNSQAHGYNILSGATQYGSTAASSKLRFKLGGSTTFNTGTGLYYRLYGHTYSQETTMAKVLLDGVVVDADVPASAPKTEEQIRSKRGNLIAETDWWATSDRTMTAAQIQYRQDLRDVPTQAGFPTNVTWPTKP